MNDNYPSSMIDWTGKSTFKRRQHARLLVAVIVMLIAFVGVTTLAYNLLASGTSDRAILLEDASSNEMFD
ncbi:hypothetical protein [Ochrobactrum sp. BTU2]|jgi:hypothetical protein|uniref:hypothetical protein n=1 Tax=Brucella/Ochrobactrum group TaxID=2826938 RepID=UPI002119E58D|nr:hypothetical protein [Ochrobactrum sp. BTU2]MCQ9148310.1 hypothetical protein [Ochrobactrum sp. BTU2]MCR5943676.1 hypothetical protein [Ochrobactrum sp. XJ1]